MSVSAASAGNHDHYRVTGIFREIRCLGQVVLPRRVGVVALVEEKDADAEVRAKAALALAQMRAVDAVLPLIAALKDTDAEVRRRAALALREVIDKRPSTRAKVK